MFSSDHNSNALRLVQIGTKIQPGISGAMFFLCAVRETIEFAHGNTDPSFTILPIHDVNAQPCSPITSSKYEKGFPEYWTAIAKYIFVKLKYALNMK